MTLYRRRTLRSGWKDVRQISNCGAELGRSRGNGRSDITRFYSAGCDIGRSIKRNYASKNMISEPRANGGPRRPREPVFPKRGNERRTTQRMKGLGSRQFSIRALGTKTTSCAPNNEMGGSSPVDTNRGYASKRGYKLRLDYKKISENVDQYKEIIRLRNTGGDPDQVAALYDRYRGLLQEQEGIRHRRKALASASGHKGKDKKQGGRRSESKEDIKAAKVDGKAADLGVGTSSPSMEELREEGRRLKEEDNQVSRLLEEVADALELEALRIPNDLHTECPHGDESKAQLVQMIGSKPEYDFELVDHEQLCTNLGLADFDSASRLTGSKFVYLKNDGAMFEMALALWAMNRLQRWGWEMILPPDLVRAHVVEGCGFQPRGAASQVYQVADSDLCLAGTSEITLAGMKENEMLRKAELPLRLAGYSHCFRKEVGGGGKQERGLYRLHQFSKVEMFAYTTEDGSDAMLEEMLGRQIELYEELGLHCRVLEMPTEELGASAYRKYDVEAWMPGKGQFGEISSASSCTDYQARRLNIRYKDHDRKQSVFVHTVNGTAVAIPRLLLTILETYQQENGSVMIPEVLRPYMGDRAAIVPIRRSE